MCDMSKFSNYIWNTHFHLLVDILKMDHRWNLHCKHIWQRDLEHGNLHLLHMSQGMDLHISDAHKLMKQDIQN